MAGEQGTRRFANDDVKPQSGEVRQVYFDERSDQIATVAMPKNSLPQPTDGTQIFNFNFTPKKLGNKLIVETKTHLRESSNVDNTAVIVIYKDNVAIGGTHSVTGNSGNFVNSGHPYAVKSFTADSFSINIMIRAGIGNGTLNSSGDFAAALADLGGLLNTWIKITEIEA